MGTQGSQTSQPSLIGESKASERFVSRNKVDSALERTMNVEDRPPPVLVTQPVR